MVFEENLLDEDEEEFISEIIDATEDSETDSIEEETSPLEIDDNDDEFSVVVAEENEDDKQLSDGDNGTKNHELKQQLVADWIKSQAPQHRELQIELQKQCLLHYKNEFEQAFLKEFPDS